MMTTHTVNRIIFAGSIIMAALLTGCTSYHHPKQIKGLSSLPTEPDKVQQRQQLQPQDAGRELYLANQKILNERYADEREYLGTNGSPELGISLSGGGTRAACFSLGVLKGLQEKGLLEQVDVISSVSGGSYAAYWLFSQAYYNRGEDGNTVYGFDPRWFETWEETATNLDHPDRYKFQNYVEQSSRIADYDHENGIGAMLQNWCNYVGDIGLWALSLPVHGFCNGIFDWEVNLNPLRRSYQNGLERTYGFYPEDHTLKHFSNAENILWVRRARAKQISFQQMQDYLKKCKETGNKFPYFIINATSKHTHHLSAGDNENLLSYTNYEFTPWQYGSEEFPYAPVTPRRPAISVSRAVSISGAAVDGQSEDVDIAGKESEMPVVFPAILKLLNLDLGYIIDNPACPTSKRVVHDLLPWPFYIFHNWSLGNDSIGIRLSDGGHSENLGLYSLVRRGVKNIIVVDSEHDAESMFTSAKRLQRHLFTEMGLKLTFDQKLPINVFAADKSVIAGKITGLPDKNGQPTSLNLTYIKLSMDETRLRTPAKPGETGPYSYNVRHYQRNNKDFPQESTADIFYGPEQVKAYRDLGATIVREHDFGKLK